MDIKAAAIHVSICIVVGGLVAAFTPAKWLSVSLWVSASMFVNGSIAMIEDARPGGFDNPDGSETPAFAKGIGAAKFTLQALIITSVLVGLGLYIQFR